MGAVRRFLSRSFTERNPVVIGSIAVGVILVFVAASIVLNKNVFAHGKNVAARFTNAAGLRNGDQVLLAGVPVGTVQKVEQKGDFVYAHMTVSGGTDLPADTAATIQVETLLGQVAVKLEPGHDWSHPLPDGATITDTVVPTEFQQLQNAAGPVLAQSDVNSFNQLLGDLAKVTSGKQAQVAQIISGLDKLSTTIDDRRAEVSQLIDASNQVSTALAGRDQQLVSVIDNLETVLNGLAQRRQQLSDMIANTEAVANQTASLVGDNRAKLDALLSSLNGALGVVSAHQVDLAQGLSYLASAVQGFSSVGYSGSADFPNNWANIYTNLVGGGDQVLGSCGYLDEALDAALGPDPAACSARVGPQTGGTAPDQPNPNGSNLQGSPSSSGSSSSASSPSANATNSTLPSIIAPLMGAQ